MRTIRCGRRNHPHSAAAPAGFRITPRNAFSNRIQRPLRELYRDKKPAVANDKENSTRVHRNDTKQDDFVFFSHPAGKASVDSYNCGARLRI